VFNSSVPPEKGGVRATRMPSLVSPVLSLRNARQSAPRHTTVQLVVRVPTREAQLARCTLHGLVGDALGVHTIDIDRRSDLACLHVELDRRRVAEAMALLMRTLSCAEFGSVRRLERVA
jgi:hypothetical protein